MRIGQVSQQYHISVDNLYYYIKYGLLVPPKPKGQYVFDEQTIGDLEQILELKQMDFSLQEIHRILSLYRVSDLTDKEDIQELRQLYESKRDFFVEEAEKLYRNTQRLEQKIQELAQQHQKIQERRGVPIRMLDLLCCPNCGETLQITEVDMNLRYIFEGKLHCTCGYQAKIEDGIFLTPNKNKNLQDRPDVTRELYKDLPPTLISLFQRSYNWMKRKLEQINTENQVVLETYVNAWFFLHHHQKYFSNKGKYIVVDKYPETLQMYKNLIEKQNYDLDILYIADSSTNLPLQKHSVNINIDFFATNEHNFYKNTFLFEKLKPYFAAGAQMLGTYFYFEQGQKSMNLLLKQYPECSKQNFNLSYFQDEMKRAGYQVIEEEDCGYSTDSGTNLGFGFHVKGEKMHLMPYLAKTPLKSEQTFEK